MSKTITKLSFIQYADSTCQTNQNQNLQWSVVSGVRETVHGAAPAGGVAQGHRHLLRGPPLRGDRPGRRVPGGPDPPPRGRLSAPGARLQRAGAARTVSVMLFLSISSKQRQKTGPTYVPLQPSLVLYSYTLKTLQAGLTDLGSNELDCVDSLNQITAFQVLNHPSCVSCTDCTVADADIWAEGSDPPRTADASPHQGLCCATSPDKH